jgi:phosphate transport system protein
MLKTALEAYTKQDLSLAKMVCKSDDDVDDMFKKIIFDLVNIMKNDPQAVEQCINFMFITKYLERIADHTTNIGEWVVYNISGEHSRLAKFYHKPEKKWNPFIEVDGIEG